MDDPTLGEATALLQLRIVVATGIARLRSGVSQRSARLSQATANLSLASLLLLGAIGCGAPGAPLPPSLGIPKPVSDLRIVRKGETAALTWTQPSETTDGELVRKPGKITVLRSLVDGASSAQWQTIAQLTLPPALKDDQATTQQLKDGLAPLIASGANFASYRVLAQSSSGRGAGSSNEVSVPLVPTSPAPEHVHAVAVPSGISVSWDQSWPPENHTHLQAQYSYRIMRREEGAKNPVVVKEVGVSNAAMILVDIGIEWQKHYEYWITPVTSWQGENKKGLVEGEDSPVVAVFANDVFPPAVPQGLEAVFSGTPEQPFIDLSWTPDTEPDLAGYNIYRHLENETPVKINSELAKTSSFRDTSVTAGNKYYYSVSAVDVRGNESAKSAEASESVPH